jgi:3-dehydroquinate synthase
MEWLITRCAVLHLDHIATSGDPFEMGSARPLDFGHWAAHKLEQLSEFRVRHGEAVAIGLALDTLYSRNAGLLDARAAARVLALLRKLGFALFEDALQRRNARGQRLVLGGLEEFREHLGGQLTITMLKAVGQGMEVHAMDPAKIEAAIQELEQPNP